MTDVTPESVEMVTREKDLGHDQDQETNAKDVTQDRDREVTDEKRNQDRDRTEEVDQSQSQEIKRQ